MDNEHASLKGSRQSNENAVIGEGEDGGAVKKPVRPFGTLDKIGYAFGDFGNDFTFILASSFMLKFYTDVMGVSAAIVGMLMMAARFVDAFTDTLMGQVVDRSKPGKKGRFLPWMQRFMGPVALASFLLYASWFKDMPMTFKIVWMFGTYLLWGSVCYTGVNIPYGSMASAISDKPDDRQQLSSWRNIGATLAQMVIGVVLPLIVYYTDENGLQQLSPDMMMLASLGCSIGAVICYLVCINLCTERVHIPTKTEKFSLTALLRQLFSSRALISIIAAAIVLLLAQLTMTGMNSYIFPNYYNNAAGISISTMTGSILMLVLAAVIIPPLAARIGKREVAIFGNIIALGAFLAAYLLKIQDMYVYIVFYTVGYIGLAAFNTVIWAMIVDVIDEDNVRRGTRSDGTIYSLYSFARKVGQALSSGLTGVLLGMAGYTAATAFEPSVLDGIYTIGTLIPAIGFALLVIILFFWYPLDKKTVDANAEALRKMREQNGDK